MSEAAQSITVRPVLWRSLLFPLLYGFGGAASVSLVIRVFTGAWPHSLWPVLAGGVTGLVVVLPLIWRSLPLEFDAKQLRGPTRWCRRATLALDEVDWRPKPHPGLAAWFLGQRVVCTRDGAHKVLIDRWQYPPAQMRRFLAELDRLAGERGRGAQQAHQAGSQ